MLQLTVVYLPTITCIIIEIMHKIYIIFSILLYLKSLLLFTEICKFANKIKLLKVNSILYLVVIIDIIVPQKIQRL